MSSTPLMLGAAAFRNRPGPRLPLRFPARPIESITFRHAAGRHLAGAREAAVLTRQQAADHVRLAEAELRMIEAGEQPLGLLEAARLANLYEISLDDLAEELLWQMRPRGGRPSIASGVVPLTGDELRLTLAPLRELPQQRGATTSIGLRPDSPARCRTMADKRQARADVVPLAAWARVCSAALGLALIGAGGYLVAAHFPTTYEWSGNGTLDKSLRSVSDLSGIVTASLLAGVGLLAYALNGVRLVRFGIGSMVAEGSPAVQHFKEQPPSETEAKSVQVPDSAVDPTKRPAAVLANEMAVFDLVDVPARVIADALQLWPGDAGDAPDTLDLFEYASRQQGRGPHPWILKFRNRPEVRVFYGGRGKSDATVRLTES